MTRNYTQTRVINLELRIPEHSTGCWYTFHGYSFTLSECERYLIGSKIRIIGRPTIASAKDFFEQKRLEVQEVTQLDEKGVSGGVWLGKLYRFLANVRSSCVDFLGQTLPEPHASFIAGVVFGGSASLPHEWQRYFTITGLTHVLSASGYNVSVVANVLYVLMTKHLPRFLEVILTSILVVGYGLMAGAGAPVVRAVVMLLLSLICRKIFFRQYHLKWSLLMTGWLMILVAPWYSHSLSFWLSMTATAGIILFLPVLESSQGAFWRLETGQLSTTASSSGQRSKEHHSRHPHLYQLLSILRESLLVTVAAQIFTAPLILFTFGELSVLSFAANTVLLWLTPLITVGGLAYLGMGGILQLFPRVWNLVQPTAVASIWLPAELFLEGVRWLGQFEGGLITWHWSWSAVLVWWGGVVGLIWYQQRTQRRKPLCHG